MRLILAVVTVELPYALCWKTVCAAEWERIRHGCAVHAFDGCRVHGDLETNWQPGVVTLQAFSMSGACKARQAEQSPSDL
jgi:hypothetical protein